MPVLASERNPAFAKSRAVGGRALSVLFYDDHPTAAAEKLKA